MNIVEQVKNNVRIHNNNNNNYNEHDLLLHYNTTTLTRRKTSSAEKCLKPRINARLMVLSMLMVSVLAFSIPPTLYLIGQQQQPLAYAQQESTSSMMSSASPLPQPNANNTILSVEATNGLFEPAAGLSNVFGPEGVFAMPDVFQCADTLTCGVSAGNNGTFTGTFEEGNQNNMTSYEATYTSPVTYGPHQIEGHTYKITLKDTQWNSIAAAEPTRQPEFVSKVDGVGFDQIQHGASNIDRSDVPQLSNMAFLYGHATVTDITNGNNTIVADDVFTHVMVGHVMDEDTFYSSLRDEAQSPTMVFLFAINIPNDTELPGVGSLSGEEAQGFTPLPTDRSLNSPPPVAYPVTIPEPREGQVEAPAPQSVTWPVANPEQPLLFTFLVYQDTRAELTSGSDGTSSSSSDVAPSMNSNDTTINTSNTGDTTAPSGSGTGVGTEQQNDNDSNEGSNNDDDDDNEDNGDNDNDNNDEDN